MIFDANLLKSHDCVARSLGAHSCSRSRVAAVDLRSCRVDVTSCSNSCRCLTSVYVINAGELRVIGLCYITSRCGVRRAWFVVGGRGSTGRLQTVWRRLLLVGRRLHAQNDVLESSGRREVVCEVATTLLARLRAPQLLKETVDASVDVGEDRVDEDYGHDLDEDADARLHRAEDDCVDHGEGEGGEGEDEEGQQQPRLAARVRHEDGDAGGGEEQEQDEQCDRHRLLVLDGRVAPLDLLVAERLQLLVGLTAEEVGVLVLERGQVDHVVQEDGDEGHTQRHACQRQFDVSATLGRGTPRVLGTTANPNRFRSSAPATVLPADVSAVRRCAARRHHRGNGHSEAHEARYPILK